MSLFTLNRQDLIVKSQSLEHHNAHSSLLMGVSREMHRPRGRNEGSAFLNLCSTCEQEVLGVRKTK